MKVTSTARQQRGADREELILSILSHVQSASAKLKQLHDGTLYNMQSGINAVQTEIRKAYVLSERLNEPEDYHTRATAEGDIDFMVERTIGPKGSY